MNNADWLEEKQPSAEELPDSVVRWSDSETCTTGKQPENLCSFDLVRIFLGDGLWSDDFTACDVDWTLHPTYQVLHTGEWNTNHDGKQPEFLNENTYVEVLLVDAAYRDVGNVAMVRQFDWATGMTHSISHYRVVSKSYYEAL